MPKPVQGPVQRPVQAQAQKPGQTQRTETMKKALKSIAVVMGLAWLLWVSALLYWMIAPRILGPEKVVRAACSSIQPGMPIAALEDIIRQGSGLKTTTHISAESDRYVSKVTGNWLCTCGVQMDGNQVELVKDVICVD